MVGRSLKASQAGIIKANSALNTKFQGSRERLAADVSTTNNSKNKGITLQPIHKFFTGKTVDKPYFIGICKALELEWQEIIAESAPKNQSQPETKNQEKSSEKISDINELMQQVRQHCCDKIQHLYSKIRLLNLQQIDVDKLYVDVYVLEKLSSVCFATIPELLKDSNLRDDFNRFGLGQRGKRSPGFEIANKYPRLMVLGKPGSGKSTFLRHLAVDCCKGQFQPDLIPILIELRSIKTASQFDLLKYIHGEFDLSDEEQTKQILKQGKVLILLDGLDEVPSQSRRDVQNHISEFSHDYYKNRFILTCRTQTTEYTLPTFDYVEVADFNKEQVENFAQNWFATSVQTSEEGEKLKEDFIEKLRQNKQIADLAVTPILLSLTCWVFSELKDLPSRRSQLYTRGLNLLLQQWDEQRGINREFGSERYRKLLPQEKQKLLSYVAHRKFEQEQFVLFEENEFQRYIAEYLKDISTEDSKQVLKAIEAQHGLFIERAQGIYSFSHLTFQEYLTAQYIIDYQQVENLVTEHLTDERWREVFLLVADLKGENAGDMLLLMQKEAQKYINTPKLQELLRWADEVTAGSAGDVNPVGKRALALAIAHTNTYANTYGYDYENTYDYDYANTYVNTYADAIANADLHAYADAIATAGFNVYANLDALDLSIVGPYEIADAIANGYADAINLTRELEKLKIFNNFNSTELIKQLEAQESHIFDEKQPQKERQKFAESLQESLLNAFNLTQEKVDLSRDEISRLENYLYANSLIIECKQAAVEVPSKIWEAIEERMLLIDK
ncbi:histidine kinase [Brasilonema octagenarum UFV-E1]|uniref:Histidine kinase n=1 Tax=Brasilonema sennae CENA114 TaxID=415709 RepID=A0A856MD04_9CYAN|nr:NACHT domain-containing protein [Brasilonema sennae]QDL08190.1 histidine kinase [Brasilonema sennae CENA114]QDL14548.1 histidine kinase [Brasilonema octagenarum UFV-E1]